MLKASCKDSNKSVRAAHTINRRSTVERLGSRLALLLLESPIPPRP